MIKFMGQSPLGSELRQNFYNLVEATGFLSERYDGDFHYSWTACIKAYHIFFLQVFFYVDVAKRLYRVSRNSRKKPLAA